MRWRRHRIACLSACALVVLAAVARADDSEPLRAFNQNPFAQIHGLPAIGAARIMPRGETEVTASFASANSFTSSSTANEEIRLDGETHRTEVVIRHGLARNIEIGFELPYVAHRPGFLDSFINNWHDELRLPQGGRDDTPHNQLVYRYRRDGVTRVDITRTREGVGDARLTGAFALAAPDENSGHNAALRTLIKLPTGESSELLGSGATDVAAWMSLRCAHAVCPGALGWYGGAGAMVLGRGDILPELTRRFVPFGSLGGWWRAFPTLALKAQIDAHGPMYSGSSLDPLRGSAQLVLGGTWQFAPRAVFEFSVAEDIAVDTAPDATLFFLLRVRL